MTNEEISKLSDFELNFSIAEFVFPISDVVTKEEMISCEGKPDEVQVIHEPALSGEYVDYCNNWNDLMPLIVEHMITPSIYANRVTVEDVIYGCEVELDFCEFGRHHEYSLEHKEKVTQRALAECLLQVLIVKEAD